MTRLWALAETSMTRNKNTKLSYRHRPTIGALTCESHIVPQIQRPARIHKMIYQIKCHTSFCVSCQLNTLAKDTQHKVEGVAGLSRL